ncbi:hypothetical protein LB503_010917 [Fusarium chuoi]|nr:hypothetical protein LB503_010917 [Fusarium chuoi]
MDVVIHRFGGLEFSPYQGNQSITIPQSCSLTSSYQNAISISQISWIHHVSQFAQSGVPQAVVLFLSLMQLIYHLDRIRRQGSSCRSKAAKVRWPYELASQIARLTAVHCIKSTLSFWLLWPFSLQGTLCPVSRLVQDAFTMPVLPVGSSLLRQGLSLQPLLPENGHQCKLTSVSLDTTRMSQLPRRLAVGSLTTVPMTG